MKKKGYSHKKIQKFKKAVFGDKGLLSHDTENVFYFELCKFMNKHEKLLEEPYMKRFVQKIKSNVENAKYNTNGRIRLRSFQFESVVSKI